MQGQGNKLKYGVLLLAALFIFTACGKKDQSESASTPSSDSSLSSSVASMADASSNAASAGSLSGSTPAGTNDTATPPAATPQVQLSPGKFFHFDNERYPEARAPFLELQDGQQAFFHANTGSGMADVTGTYAINGNSLVFTITSIEGNTEFWGASFTTLTFNIIDENYLYFTGDAFGLTLSGNVFGREGMPPYQLPPPGLIVIDGQTPYPQSSSGADSVGAAQSQAPAPSSAQPPAPSQSPAASKPGSQVGSQAGSQVGSSLPESTSASQPQEEKGGFPWLIILIVVGSILAGSGVTFVLLTMLKKKKGDGAAAGSEEPGYADDGDIAAAKEQLRQAKAGKKAEKVDKKAAKKAAAAAAKKEKTAAKAAQVAEKAAAKAKKAAADAENAKATASDSVPKTKDAQSPSGEGVSKAEK